MFKRILRRLAGRKGSSASAPSRPSAPAPVAAVPSIDPGPTELVLFKFDRCPYCRRVMQVIEERNLDVEYADVRQDPSARARLEDRTGRTTVPCLFINDQPLFESADIIAWLESHANARPRA